MHLPELQSRKSFTLEVQIKITGNEIFFTLSVLYGYLYCRQRFPLPNLRKVSFKTTKKITFSRFFSFQEDVLFEAEEYAKMTSFDYEGGKVSGAVYLEQDQQHKELLNKVITSPKRC